MSGGSQMATPEALRPPESVFIRAKQKQHVQSKTIGCALQMVHLIMPFDVNVQKGIFESRERDVALRAPLCQGGCDAGAVKLNAKKFRC